MSIRAFILFVACLVPAGASLAQIGGGGPGGGGTFEEQCPLPPWLSSLPADFLVADPRCYTVSVYVVNTDQINPVVETRTLVIDLKVDAVCSSDYLPCDYEFDTLDSSASRTIQQEYSISSSTSTTGSLGASLGASLAVELLLEVGASQALYDGTSSNQSVAETDSITLQKTRDACKNYLGKVYRKKYSVNGLKKLERFYQFSMIVTGPCPFQPNEQSVLCESVTLTGTAKNGSFFESPAPEITDCCDLSVDTNPIDGIPDCCPGTLCPN